MQETNLACPIPENGVCLPVKWDRKQSYIQTSHLYCASQSSGRTTHKKRRRRRRRRSSSSSSSSSSRSCSNNSSSSSPSCSNRSSSSSSSCSNRSSSNSRSCSNSSSSNSRSCSNRSSSNSSCSSRRRSGSSSSGAGCSSSMRRKRSGGGGSGGDGSKRGRGTGLQAQCLFVPRLPLCFTIDDISTRLPSPLSVNTCTLSIPQWGSVGGEVNCLSCQWNRGSCVGLELLFYMISALPSIFFFLFFFLLSSVNSCSSSDLLTCLLFRNLFPIFKTTTTTTITITLIIIIIDTVRKSAKFPSSFNNTSLPFHRPPPPSPLSFPLFFLPLYCLSRLA